MCAARRLIVHLLAARKLYDAAERATLAATNADAPAADARGWRLMDARLKEKHAPKILARRSSACSRHCNFFVRMCMDDVMTTDMADGGQTAVRARSHSLF